MLHLHSVRGNRGAVRGGGVSEKHFTIQVGNCDVR